MCKPADREINEAKLLNTFNKLPEKVTTKGFCKIVIGKTGDALTWTANIKPVVGILTKLGTLASEED